MKMQMMLKKMIVNSKQKKLSKLMKCLTARTMHSKAMKRSKMLLMCHRETLKLLQKLLMRSTCLKLM